MITEHPEASEKIENKNLKSRPVTHKEVSVLAKQQGRPIYVIVDEMWAMYRRAITSGQSSQPGAAQSSEPKRGAQSKYPYRDGWRRWHDLLEEVLADPEESIGIEKNLAWAALAVREKRGPKKRLAR